MLIHERNQTSPMLNAAWSAKGEHDEQQHGAAQLCHQPGTDRRHRNDFHGKELALHEISLSQHRPGTSGHRLGKPKPGQKATCHQQAIVRTGAPLDRPHT